MMARRLRAETIPAGIVAENHNAAKSFEEANTMKYNEKTAAAVINSLLRAARKMPRESLRDAWTDEQGRTCATDGFRAYCLNTAPAGMLETLTSCPDPARAAAYAAGNNKIMAYIFKPLDAGKTVEMPAPDADAVKAFMAADKQQGGRGVYDLGKEFPAVNIKYLWDIIRLFPAAKWYVLADPYARMVSPVFIVADEGRACLLPIRQDSKPWKAPEAPAPAPAEKPAAAKRPEIISNNPAPALYAVYVKLPRAKSYALADMANGRVGVRRIYAPVYNDSHLDKLKELLDEVAGENHGHSFQIRTMDKRPKIIYAAVPTVTPEMFADMIAA